VRRHASADEMASYAAGDMRPRKAARIAAHLDQCAECRQLVKELEGVSSLLASVNFAPMASKVSARIEAAIATESVHRVSAEPATEAGRRDLPTRARRSRLAAWRLSGIPPAALRTVATAAAAVVVVGGAYELISHGPGQSSGPANSARAFAPRAASGFRSNSMRNLSFGPDVTLTSDGHHVSLRTARTTTNFGPSHLQAQVTSAVTQASNDGLIASNKHMLALSPGMAAGDLNPADENATAQRLAGCIERVAATRIPELVDLATFERKPATIIVLAAISSHPAEVLVVGTKCSAAASDLLYRQVLKHV
jgi:hypothetical protein